MRTRITVAAGIVVLAAFVGAWNATANGGIAGVIDRWAVTRVVPSERPMISMSKLRANLFYLADDARGGRAAGTAGYDAAADFVVEELRNYGLAPLFPDAGGASYQQHFAVATWNVRDDGRMLIRGGNEASFDLLRDVQVAYLAEGSTLGTDLPVVYVGAGVVEEDLGYDDYANVDIDGACVAILFDLPRSMLRDAPAELRARNPEGNEGILRRVRHAADRGAVCAIALPGQSPPTFWPQFLADPNQLQSVSSVPPGDAPFIDLAVGVSDRASRTLFAGQAGDPSRDDSAGSFRLEGVTVRFDFEHSGSNVATTANIGGLIPGTDPAAGNEVIVLTAHLDGQGTRPDGTVLNSANDNAASVVALLEAARHMMAAPARRPVAVVLTGAEENGLLGAEYFLDDPPVELARIALNVNLEMVGKRRRGFGGYQFRVSGRHSDHLATLVKTTERMHGDVDFDYERRFETPDYQFRRADHARFFLRGIPTLYFYGGGADYHQPSDDADRIEYGKVRMMAEVLVHLIRATDDLARLPVSDGRP